MARNGRPNDLTAEEFKLFKEEAAEFKVSPDCKVGFLPEPLFTEIFVAGEYIRSRLELMGVEKSEIKDLCFAGGQMMSNAIMKERSIWEGVKQLLDEVRSGKFPKPGSELAQRLLNE